MSRPEEYRFSPAIEAALIAGFRRGHYTDAELAVVPDSLVWGEAGLSTLAKYLAQAITDRDDFASRLNAAIDENARLSALLTPAGEPPLPADAGSEGA